MTVKRSGRIIIGGSIFGQPNCIEPLIAGSAADR
jgi:hypothetical protein